MPAAANIAKRNQSSGYERVRGSHRQRVERHAAAFEHRAAFPRIAEQRGELALGRPARRIVEVERRPGVVLRMLGQPGARGEEQRAGHE